MALRRQSQSCGYQELNPAGWRMPEDTVHFYNNLDDIERLVAAFEGV